MCIRKKLTKGENMNNRLTILRQEFNTLLEDGRLLLIAWLLACNGDALEGISEDDKKAALKLHLVGAYQRWYSAAFAVVKQLLPERVAEFADLYENKDSSKELKVSNFRIANALRGKALTRYVEGEKKEVAGMSSCSPLLSTQYAILQSAEERFEKSLFDVQQVLQADLFDSEVDAARELNNKGFARAAGAMVGVVLEKHLNTVLSAHGLSVAKKNSCINDYNQKLKDETVIDIPTWRFIQRLGDIRNLCDHSKGTDPSKENIAELIDGVDKIMKTIA